MKRTGLFLALVSVLAISILSCDVEIGLGASVDTRAPELTIQNPPAGSVIRDVFAMSGTCGDDGTIASISVELKHTESGEVLPAFEGTFNQKEGTWSCEINPLDEKTPVPDGSYEATVTIKDGSERETIRTRAYTIDNTAPVLAITRPSSVIPTGTDTEKYPATDYDSYGQDLIIEGHVADTCERRFISVDIYDMKGEKKYSTLEEKEESSKYIKIDSDFSTTIASSGDSAYTLIYGDDDEAGTKMYYCKITVYDSARKYPLDSSTLISEDLLGNSADYFYMYEGDLYDSVFDTYGMTNAYKLLNGSFEDDGSRSADTTTPEEAKLALENVVYQETMGFLSLNPKNNPYFKVSGHEPFSAEEMENGTVFESTENHITNNSTIVVEVYPGLDQTPLLQDTLGLYLIRTDDFGNVLDSNGKIITLDEIKEEDKIWLVRPLIKKEKNGTDWEDIVLLTKENNQAEISARNNAISKIGSTYKFTIDISTKNTTADGHSLFAGDKYIFGVQGCDRKNVPVKNAGSVLGFKLVESGTAPTLTIKSVTPKYITTNESSITDNAEKTVKVLMAFAGDAPFRLKRIVNDGEEVEVLTGEDNCKETDYIDEYTPSQEEFTSGQVSIRYILTGNNNLTNYAEDVFYIDNDSPVVNSLEVPDTDKTENSSYKFSGEVSDGNSTSSSKIAEVQMKLSCLDDEDNPINDAVGNPVASEWVNVGDTDKWNHIVVFQSADDEFNKVFTVEGKKKVEVRAIDTAGNISEIFTKTFLYDTDSPNLTVQTYKMGNDAEQAIKNNFFISKGFSISGTVEDGYGIESLILKQTKGEEADTVEITIPVDNNGNWTIENLPRNNTTNEVLLETGVYSFVITAKDLAGKEEKSAIYKAEIDRDKPVVTITSPADGSTVSGTNFRFTGTLNDTGTGVTSYSYKFVKAGVNKNTVAWTPENTTSDEWSFYKELSEGTTATSSSLCEGEWSLFVRTIDGAGNESVEVEHKFTIDKNIPSLEANITNSPDCIYNASNSVWYYSDELSGTISYSDTFAMDSSTPYTFSMGDVDITSALDISDGTWTINSSRFNAIEGFDSSSLNNTQKVLSIIVKDKVGRTNSKTFTVYKDTQAPDAVITYPEQDAPISDAQFTARGSISDGTGVGIDSFVYSINGGAYQPLNSEIIGSTWSKAFDFEGQPEGEVTLEIMATDKLGNEAAASSVTFFYDKQNPQIIISDDNKYYENASSYTLSGTAYDTNRLSYVTIQDNTTTYSSAGTNPQITLTGVDTAVSEATAANWSKIFTTGSNGILKDGLHTFRVTAYDSSNRVSTTLTKELFVDTTAPVISSIVTPSAQDTEESYYQFSGMAADNTPSNAVSQNAASGIEKIMVMFADKNTPATKTAWLEATGTTRWNLLVTYANATFSNVFGSNQGEKVIYVKAIDMAGNESNVEERTFVYDKAQPAVSISSYTIGSNNTPQLLGATTQFDVSNAFSLSGTASDTYKLKSIQVFQKKDDGEDQLVVGIPATTTSCNWTVSGLPRAENSFGSITGTADTETDATYRYYVKVFDDSSTEGKTSQTSPITVRIDKTAPTVTITSPAEDFATANDVISGSSKIFEGTAVDNENGSGLASYSYAFSQNNTAPAANSNEWTTINAENGNWSIRRDLLATATTNTSPESLTQGEWYLFVKAVDKAGNAISSPVTRHFWVDQSAPSLSNVNIEGGVYYYNTNTLTLTGNAFDSNALAANDAVVIKSGDTVLETIPGSDVAANGNWSVILTADDIPVNEATAITIEVKDCVGRTSGVSSYTVCRDMTSPAVTASLATDAERVYQKSVNYTFSGTATDANLADVIAVLYKNDVETDQETALSPRGTEGAWEWKVYDLEEAYYSIKITARDRANNQTEYTSGSVMIDTTAPLSTISGTSLYDSDGVSLATPATNAAELTNGTTIDAGRYYAQSSYTLSGIITEANFVNTTSTLELKENGTTKNVAFTGNGTTASPYSWSYTPASLTDGTYAYSLKLTDKAGNTTTYSATVIYDTTAPELGIDVPVQNMAYGTMPPANGTVTDAGIGIAEIKWSSNNVDWSDATMTTATNWSANLGTMDSEGPVTLYVKAKDKFGRETPRNVNFSYDLYNPQLTETDTVDEYQKAGYSFTLTGTAGDTNALDCITITEGGTNTYGSTNASDTSGTARITTQNAAVTLSENNGNTALSAESGKGKSWSITFSANDTAPLSQGRHTFNITAKDSAGKTSTSEVKNIFIDTFAPQVLTAVTPTTSQTANASFRFTGTAKDNNNSSADSRVELIKVKFNSYASATATESSATTEWFDANGDTSWNYIAVFTDEGLNSVFGNNEGYKTISVKAIDYAGNESAVFESPKFLYDRELPTSSINSYTAGSGSAVNLTSTPSFFANNTFKLSITANDGYSVKKIVVKQKNSGVTKTVYTLDNINLNSKTVDVLNLPRDVSGLDDDEDDATETSALTLDENSSGEYEYTVEVTDVAGKSASVASVKANIDKKVPVITLTTELNADFYQGLSKTFSFTASDPKAEDGSTGSGLSKYYYMFTQETGTQTVSSSGWTEKDASSSFDVIPSLVSGNTLGTNGELNEGHWYLWYYVKDVAGNTSAPTSADFWLDQGAPTLTAAITPAENSIVGSGTEFYFKNGLSGTISANDSSNVDPTLTYTINGGTAVPVTGTSWTIPASSFTNEGTYSVVFTATDQVGRTATKEFTVYKDTSAPTVGIQSPAATASFEQQTINIRGSVNDTIGSGENAIPGSGPKEIWYKTNNNAWIQLTSYTAGGSIWNDNVDLNNQGNVTLYVKAKDNLGNESTPVDVSFYFDSAAPELTVADVDETLGTGYTLTLTGAAYDSNELDYIEIVDKIGDTLQGTYKVDNDSSTTDTITITNGTITEAKNESTAVTWSKTFTSSDPVATRLAQGQHTFTISAKDTSSRPATIKTKSVFIDTEPPVVAITTPSAAGFSKSAYVTFSGTVTEANFDSLEIKLYKSGVTDSIETVNATPQGANGNWSYTANLPDEGASYYITAKATDKVGNENTETSAQITTDFTAPTTSLTSSGLTNESANAVTEILENVTYYAKGNYTVSGEIEEEHYDRTKVTITAKNGSTDITGTALTTLQSSLAASLTSDTDKTWSFTGITGTGTYEYSLKIEDKAANSKTYKIKVVYDNTAPETLSITTAETSGVNSISGSSKTFEGSASDSGSGLSSYSYAFTQGDSAPAADSNDWTKVEKGNGSWSFTRTVISSTSPSPNCLHEGLWTLYVKATDKAGNTTTTPVSRQYWVDQSAPAITDLNNAAINYFNGTLTITGKAIDTNALATSGAVVIKNGEETLATINSVASDGSWTASINGSITANTAVDLTIQAKDCVGKPSDAVTYTVYKDTNAPVITFTSPSGDLARTAPLSGTSGIFSGTTSDTASGVASYSYVFSQSSTAPTTGWTSVTNAVTSWSIPKTFTAGIGTAANDEGQWYLFVKAADRAGNETTTASSLSFWYDNSVPTLTTSMTTTAGSCISNNNTYYFNGTFDTNTVALKGSITASDTSAVAPEITYKIDSGNEVSITGISATAGTRSGTWSIPSSAFTQDGEYTVKIIATDQCGRKAEQTYTVYRDTSAPTIAITTPNPSAQDSARDYEQETLNVNGTVSDGTSTNPGSGVNKVYYSTDNGASWTQLTSYAPGSSSWREYLNLQGEVTLSVKAEDYLGKESTPASVTYTLDAAAPVLTVGNVDSTQGTGYSFTLTGTAYDTNALSYVEIEDKIGTTVQGTYSTSNGKLSITSGTVATAKSEATKVTWSKTFSASDETPLAQGQHTFTIKAKDVSNRDVVTETRSVLVDTQAPVLAITTPSAAGFTKSAYVTFSGTLDEANFDSLEIKLYKAGFTNAIETTTANPQGTNGSWSYTANLPDEGASYYITATATDKVGNSATETSAQITTDFTAPATTLTSSGLTNESAEPVTAISENVTYYAKDSYTVSGTITEANYDRTKVTITAKKDNADATAPSITVNTDKTWSFAGITGTGTYEYSLKIEDKAANNKTYKIKVVYDNTAPETLSITTAATSGEDSISGSSKTFAGTASDSGSGLSSYSYAFTQGNSAPAADSNDWTKVETGNGSWSFIRTVISSTSPSPNCLHEGLWTLYVKATDKAGNTSTTPVSRQYWVDQSAPAITDLSNAAINYFNGNLTITGKAIDTNALAASGAVVIKNGEETLATINSVASDGSWTASINGSSITANTEVALTIQAKDCVGKTSEEVTYTVYKDTNPPVIAFTSPDGNLAQTEPLSGTSGIFSGTTTDAASGVASYSYVFSKSSTAPATGWTTVTNAVTSWSIPKTFTAGTGTAANDEGQWYLFVKAEDKAGNQTAAASSLSFWYDNSVPTITASMTTATGKCENKDGKYYFNGTIAANTALTGSITASDTSAVAPTISYKIGSGTEVAIEEDITESTGTSSGTWSIPSSAFTQDGEYTVKIIATDQCGRKAEQTYNVYRDTSAPTITITAPVAATGTIVKTASYTFGGTIADPTFYSASAVLYKDTAATDTTTTIEVNDDNTWTWKPTGLEDGTYHIVITAKDKVSNTATQTTGTVIVDRTAPATSIVPAGGNNITDASFAAVDELENGKTYYTSSSYTITGVINDNNWGTGATAKYKIDNGAETTLTVNASTKAWSLPAATAGHTYEIKLKDSAGNENTYSFTISYDNVPPTATVDIPGNNITDPLYALSANNYSFKLSASDGGVGVKELSYIFTQTDSLPAANAAWETDSNFTTADKYVVMDLVALHPANSSTPNGLTRTQLPEGIWYLWVKAKDKAGNITSDETITANRRKIIVDKSNPTLTVTNSLNETGTNPIYEDVTNSGYTVGGTVSDTNALAVTDTEVDEANRVYSIEIKVDGVTATRIASSELTGTNSDTWSYTIPKTSIHTNGLTEVEVIAKDVVGKTTSKKYNLYYDTTAPELEVTAPVGDEQVENAEKIIKGTVRDDGYGLARLEFVLKNSSNVTVKDSSNNDISGYWEATANGSTSAGNYPLKIKGEQWFYAGQPDGEGNVAGNTALTIPLGTAEGTLKLIVTATEKVVGNHTARTETEEITFYYDAAEPNITESGSVNRITNTDFVLTGTAYDTNQLAKIEIKQGGVLKATTEANPAAGVVAISFANGPDSTAEGYNGSYSLASAISQSTQGTWKATFPASGYNDGSYQFSITATDISGKVTSVTRTIQMDKTPPANISPSVTTSGTTIDSKNWYNSRALAISVTATDTNGSGVSTAEYSTVAYEAASSTADPTEAYRSWTNIPNNGSAFVGTVNLPADGENTFYVRVKDIAGNYGYNNTGLTVYIDSAAPASATVASVDGVVAGDGENQFGGTKLTNGSADIAFTMTASDAGTVGTNATGIDTIKIIKVGANTLEGNAQIEVTESEGVLGAEIPSTSVTTSGGVIARVTDKVGNSYDFTLFQIQFDNKYPKVTISNIADADTSVAGTQINGTTTISGTASDDQTLASVKLQYQKKTGNTWPTGWTDTNLTNQGTIYSWSFNVNTTQSPYTDGDSVRFRVLATDAAGNEGNSGTTGTTGTALGKIYGTGNSAAEYAEVIISQDSDRPIIRISNLEMSDANQVSGATSYYWHRYGSMYGTVQDDDGSVTSVKYKIGENGTWSEESIYSNGMWQISNLTDGAKDIYFEVIDGGNETFTSSLTKKPKVQDSQGTEKLGYSNSDDVVLKVKVDTADPRIVSTKYYLSDSKDYDAQANWTAASNLAELITKSSGGNNKYLYVRIEASDLNGINTNVEKTKFTFGNVEATTTDDTDNAINKVRKISQASDGNSTITIVRIDLSQFVVGQTGQADFVATVYDNSDKYNTESVSVRIDNSAPTLSVSNYDSGVVLYGSSNNIIRLYQDGDSDVDNVYYYVTNDANYNPANHIENGIYTDFAELSGNQVGTTTSIYFDGADSNASEYHAPKFFNIIQTLTNKTDAQMAAYDEEVSLWLWWYTVDELGNTSTPSAASKFAFKVLPNGDKPRTFITYPAEKQTGTEAPISVGGTIRITGYTEIATDSVDAVYLQIDPNYAYTTSANLLGNAFDEENWKTELEAAISGKNVSYTIVDLDDADHYPGKFTDSPYRYAIKASGTSNWSFQLNSKQEVNSSDYVAIRSFAVSKTNKKISDAVTHVVKIDANAPLIGNTVPLQVVQYENANGTGEEVARQEYTADMYLKGNWFIEGSIEHSSGIKTATWTYPNYSNGTWTTESEDIVDNGTGNSKVTLLADKGTYDNYTFKLPIGFGGENTYGKLTYTLQITDGRESGAQTVPATISINYDNKAPILNLTRSTDNSSITLLGETGSENTITQSNGTFTIEGNVNEPGADPDQSGFSRVAMFFTREDGGVTKLVDPMLAQGNTGKDNFEAITDLDYKAVDEGGDGLYWRAARGTIANNVITFATIGGTAIASVTNFDKIIRKGGLCKINNVIYRISNVDVSVKTVTVEGVIADITSESDMYFAVGALIIDHKSTEGGTSYYDEFGNTQYHTTNTYNPAGVTTLNDDDGDQMIESATKNGTAYNWSASFNSSNILDGRVTAYFVAFDNAGNVSEKAFEANVANNAPRIAGVCYGTDSNGNDRIDDNEMIDDYHGIYTMAYSSRNKGNGYNIATKVTSLTIGASNDAITVKGALTVKPEIVGGNIGLGYTYSYTKTDDNAYTSSVVAYTGAGALHGEENVVRDADLSITIPLTEFLNTNHTVKAGVQQMHFVVWDKTEGTIFGSTSGKATISLWTNVALTDNAVPSNTLRRFYWRKNNNAIESSVHYDNNGVAQGHIELEDDWMTTTAYTNRGTSTLYDADPKVSGVVYFEGVATDNLCVEKLSIYVPGLNSDNEIVFAQRNRTQGSQNLGQFENCSEVPGVEFVSAEDIYDKKNGTNTVKWKVKVDTSETTSKAATNVKIRAGAYDRGSPSLSGSNVVYADNTVKHFEPGMNLASTGTGATNDEDEVVSPFTALYQIDIVPYITGVYRKARFNTNRARSGAVSLLREEEENTITGFNLGNLTGTTIKITADKDGSENAVVMDDVDLSSNDLTFTVPGTAKSGYLQVTVNSVEALNNKNRYVDYNTETNAKSYDHNTLTDDRYVHIWRVNTADTFKGSKNAVYPAMTKASDGTLYASFTNYGQSKTYYTNQFIGSSATAVNPSSNTTGTTDGVTTVFNGYDPPEETDISIDTQGNVNVFYAANYHGGNAYNWGDDSYHNGYYYYNDTDPDNAGGIYVYDTEATSTYFGRTYHNAYRFELFTYDNELNQFKNIRVNRTYDTENTTAYVNVAYYDKLTGAIKYSYVKNADEINYTPGNTSYSFTYTETGTYAGYYATSSDIRYVSGYVKIGDNYYNMSYYNRYRPDRNTPYTYYCSFEGYTLNESEFASVLYTRNVVSVRDTSNYGLPWVVIDGDTDVTDTSALVPENQTGTNNTFSFAGGWTPKVLTDDRYVGVSSTTGTGESLSLSANPNGYPVIFYMDASSGQPRIAFANSRTPNTADNWIVQGVFALGDENYDTASDYMSCVVDSTGYLHIAFQNTKGQLVYAKSTNAPTNGTTTYTFGSSLVLDDSGMWIDLTMNDTTPYISYLSRVNSYDGMKIAFYNANFDEDNNGVAEGGWETVTAALDQKVSNVRTCIESNAKANDGTAYTAAIGFCPGSDYRAAFYVGQ